MAEEVAERGLGDFHLGRVDPHALHAADLVRHTLGCAVEVGLDVGAGLDDVAGDVEGVARGFRDGQAVVEGDAARDGAEADDHTPHLVDGQTADTTAVGVVRGAAERLLEAGGDDEGDDAGGELADALHGEDGAHHGATPLGGGELGGDDGGERVVTADTDAHEHTPEDDDADDGDGGRVGGERLGEGGEDDEEEFDPVHPLTANHVGEPTETQLTDDRAAGGGDLDGGVGAGRDHTRLGVGAVPVDYTQHGRDQTAGDESQRLSSYFRAL